MVHRIGTLTNCPTLPPRGTVTSSHTYSPHSVTPILKHVSLWLCRRLPLCGVSRSARCEWRQSPVYPQQYSSLMDIDRTHPMNYGGLRLSNPHSQHSTKRDLTCLHWPTTKPPTSPRHGPTQWPGSGWRDSLITLPTRLLTRWAYSNTKPLHLCNGRP